MSNEKPTWKNMPLAGIIFEPATSKKYRTGDFRSSKPIIDVKLCTKCRMCWVFCPDSAVSKTPEGLYEIDMEYCKGCGICAVECAPKAIKMEDEEE